MITHPVLKSPVSFVEPGAITALREPKGSNFTAITNYIMNNFSVGKDKKSTRDRCYKTFGRNFFFDTNYLELDEYFFIQWGFNDADIN